MEAHDGIGVLGLIGLLGLVPFRFKIPPDTPGARIRKLGAVGLLGLLGFWNPPLGAAGAFGALGCWKHPNKTFARLSRLAVVGFAGPLVWWFTRT